MEKIRIAILGYGNLGRGIECAVSQNEDMELMAVFTRRDPSTVKTVSGVPVYGVEKLTEKKGDIDVLMLCGDRLRICHGRPRRMQRILM